MLDNQPVEYRSLYNNLKQLPQRPTRNHLNDLIAHLIWLDSLGDIKPLLVDITAAKIQHNVLKLPGVWGDGTTAAADGTKYELYEENLLSEYHIRYGGYGGIAYHHVSDTYVALFSHFISCGTWEAVYIIEGLLKNCSDIQPDTIYF